MNLRPLTILSAALLLAACETTAPQKAAAPQHEKPVHKEAPAAAPARAGAPAAPPAPAPELPPARRDLNAGIEMYKAGNYNGAIKQLGSSPDIAKADKTVQLEALKYTAFSYCVTNRQTLCKEQFRKAFKLDRGFDLAPGEKGHPLWTPAFERARKEAGK